MYCKNCGNELHNSARFCAKCGTPVVSAYAPSPTPVPPPTYAAPAAGYRAYPAKGAKKKKDTAALCIALAILLVVQTAVVALYGWPGFAVGGWFGKSETFILQPGQTSVKTNSGVVLDMGEYPLEGEAKCEIKKVKAPSLEGVDIRAYDFTIYTDEELLSVMELTIPYDEKALGGLSPEGNVGAAYYNEKKGEWEPVSFDINDNGTITIHTEHLSSYGCFVVKNEKTRAAYAAYVIPAYAISNAYANNVDANGIITSAVNNGGNPDSDAFEAGLSVLDTALDIGSAGVDTISYGLNALSGVTGNAAGNELFNSISEKLGNLGLAVSLAQISSGMYSVYNGNTDAIFPCYKEALKGSTAYVGGKAGSKLFSLAFLGVLAIDYSITQFAETAQAGREDIYRKAYSLYYEEQSNQRSAKEWAKLFLNARETAASTERYYLRIEGLVQRYADQFWQDDTTVAYYQSEAQKLGFTGGGGLNEGMKEKISKAYANELFRGVVQDAFKLIAERDARISEKNLLKELNAIGERLNTVCTIELYDGTLTEEKKQSDMEGAKVFVSLPDTITDAESWSATLDDKGTGKIKFTLLAYLLAGLPDELRLYEKGASENDRPTATFSFLVKDFVQRVNVGKEGLSLDELVGIYETTVSVDNESESHNFYLEKYGNGLIISDKMDSLEMKYDPSTGAGSGAKVFPIGEDKLTYSYRFTFKSENGTISMTGTSTAYLNGEYQATANYQGYKRD